MDSKGLPLAVLTVRAVHSDILATCRPSTGYTVCTHQPICVHVTRHSVPNLAHPSPQVREADVSGEFRADGATAGGQQFVASSFVVHPLVSTLPPSPSPALPPCPTRPSKQLSVAAASTRTSTARQGSLVLLALARSLGHSVAAGVGLSHGRHARGARHLLRAGGGGYIENFSADVGRRGQCALRHPSPSTVGTLHEGAVFLRAGQGIYRTPVLSLM